jgi:hypothetical protein
MNFRDETVYSWTLEARSRIQTLQRLRNCFSTSEAQEIASSRLTANFSPQEITQELKARGYSLDLSELTSEQILQAVRFLASAELQEWQEELEKLQAEAKLDY